MADADFVYESPSVTGFVYWGKYIRDCKVTDEGMPIITGAMKKFHKDILRDNPNYFNKKENGRK